MFLTYLLFINFSGRREISDRGIPTADRRDDARQQETRPRTLPEGVLQLLPESPAPGQGGLLQDPHGLGYLTGARDYFGDKRRTDQNRQHRHT